MTGDKTEGQKGFMMFQDQREVARAGPRLPDSMLTQRAIRPVLSLGNDQHFIKAKLLDYTPFPGVGVWLS